MLAVKVEITKFVDDYQPGIVECSLTDAQGKTHLFVDKVPVVSLEDLDATSAYPRPGLIACQLLETLDKNGLEVLKISTELPWHVESTTGLFCFDVFPEQLTKIDEPNPA